MGVRSSRSRGPGLHKTDGHLLEYFRNSFGEGGGGTQFVVGEGHTASGGVVSDYTTGSNVYRAHVFAASGTFEVDAIGDFGDTVEYLVVAGGGGGGGGYYGGGGGAGGLRTNLSGHPMVTGNPSFTVSTTGGNGSGVYTVTIGAGGAGGDSLQPQPANNRGENGMQGIDSYFGPPSAPQGITSKGGGKGMGRGTSVNAETDGYSGGSGGGIAYRGPAVGYGYNPTTPGPALNAAALPNPYTIIQGYPGGPSPGSNFGSAGGGAGGAGGAGSPPPYGAVGGPGVQVAIAGPTNTNFTGVGAINPATNEYQWFSGGGAGGSNGPPVKAGGVGGGGNAANSLNDVDAENGQQSTGGGGGGGSSDPNPQPGRGGAGGAGIVIIRYQIGRITGRSATGGSITAFAPDSPSPMAGKTVHVFTGSGVFANTTGSPITNADYLVVAGGGSGAAPNASADGAAGGGAGGLLSSDPAMPGTAKGSQITLPTSNVIVTVGAGGGAAPHGGGIDGNYGNISSFGPTLVASGGGGGALGASKDGLEGGSGGGSSGGGSAGGGGAGNKWSPDAPGYPGNVTNQGNPGGDNGPNFGSGGGGGFTQAGFDSVSNNGGVGGAGINLTISGTSTGYAGGGGGGSAGPYRAGGPYTGGTATHGGGAGASASTTGPTYNGTPGAMNTGGGGGGGGGDHSSSSIGSEVALTQSGAGGSGIVIIAYPT